MQIPIFESLIACGFPSPAQDHVERRLSLDDELIRYPESTYFFRASGDSMKDVGIFDSDLLVVESHLTSRHGDILIAEYDGEFTCKYLQITPTKALIPANSQFPTITINDDSEVQIFGVFRYAVHTFR
ncbi:translesion error-prone DNA polymerase V autoproteolytic subunit [Providencia sp. PROV129]|uniref:translesion error-prone DNA polymerase V autoproteolytic subunit n=1 Tax=Providencia sp. PROV129 TaxID=2949839 RepID=UPI00234BB234|nr:translesion error-prone DNA polymerase V autoproteolytic subunit [Providencia sp. PROV129]